MRSSKRNDSTARRLAAASGRGNAVSAVATVHAGVDSAVPRSSVVSSPLSSQTGDAYSTGPIDAAIGIKNGLLIGASFWLVAISAISLFNYFG